MKEAKLLDCKFHEFEAATNDLLRQGWEIVNFFPQEGYIVSLFTRDAAAPTPDTPISAAPAGQTLAERLKWLRERSGLTLKEIAGLANISVSYLSDLERGRALVGIGTLFRIAPVYGVTPSALIYGITLWGDVE